MSIQIISKSIWGNPGNRGQGLRKTFDAIGWQLYKRLVRRPRTIILANGFRFRAYPDCVISSALHYADWPEYHELQFCRRHLRFGETLLDVGANVGHVSLSLADIIGPDKIFCFEPTPVAWRRLVENFELNGWPTSQLYPVAVGAAAGRLFLCDAAGPITTNALHDAKGNDDVEVPVCPLDSRRELWQNQRIGLVKIDVEGFEAKVFRGAVELLRVDRPRLVMFESLARRLDPEIATVLADVRYRAFQLDESGQPDFANVSAQNLFAAPEEIASELKAAN